MELEYFNSLIKQDSIVKDEESRRLRLQILLLKDENDELHRQLAVDNERNTRQLVQENERNIRQLALETERNRQLALENERNKQLALENERKQQQLALENERKKQQLALENERNKQQLALEDVRNAQKKKIVAPTPIITEEIEPKKKKRKVFGDIKTIFDEDYYEADKRPTKITLAPVLAKPGGNTAFLRAGKNGINKGEVEFSPLKKDRRGAKAGFLGIDPRKPL